MSELQVRVVAVLIALLILVIGGIAGYLTGGMPVLLSIEISLLIGIFLLVQILKPKRGRFWVRFTALTIFGEIAFAIFRGESLGILLWNVVAQSFDLPSIPTIEPQHQILFLLISGGVIIFLVMLFEFFEWQRTLPSVLTIPAEEEEIFQEPDYKKLRNRFCNFMQGYLDRIDEETNWSDNDYTTLEAEIEMTHQSGKRASVAADLIKTIRNDKDSQSFLLIGDPGSGKSVSLRRLARELYKEVSRQDKLAVVPIYVNLKEWDGPQEPTDEDISNFVYRYLLRISGRAGQGFLKNYYEKMLSCGLLFFLFDSFDEMPMVLDCDDRSEQIKRISMAFDTFLRDLHICRGILSSRPFRQPTGFRGRRLTIRPFHEKQIRDAMKSWLLGEGIDSDKIVRRLLAERPHLAPALRNPFMSDLLAHYIIHYRDQLPNNFYDIFDHYINRRFDEDTSSLEELKLTKEEVVETAIKIAQTIYNTSDIGLEISVSKLKDEIPDPQLEDKIRAMQYSRIVRWGGTSKERFSFVHRRFAEFFAVCALLKDPSMVNRNAIPADSRWRDGLVVYCGVAPSEEVRQLAEFAWQTIQEKTQTLQDGNVQEARAAIHCLRFLRDACQSRPESIESFQADLSELIVELIGGEDLLTAKIAAEALSLATPDARTQGIMTSFSRGLSWLSETALRACRHLVGLEYQAVNAIRLYIQRFSSLELLKAFRNLDFSLSLSDSLQRLKLNLRAEILSLLSLWTLLLIFSVYTLVDFFTGFRFWTGDMIGEMILVLLFVLFFEAVIRYTRHASKGIDISKGSRESMIWFLLNFRPGFDSSVRIAIVFFLSMNVISFLAVEVAETLIPQFPQFEMRSSLLTIFSFDWEFGLLTALIIIPGSFWVSIAKSYTKWELLLSWNHRNLKNIGYSRYQIIRILLFMLLVSLGSIFVPRALERWEWLVGPIGVAFGVYLIIQIYKIFPFLIKTLGSFSKDRRLLKQLALGTELTWTALCQTTNNFQSEWGQIRYLEMLRVQKIRITDNGENFPPLSLKGINAEAEMARLKEQVYDLQE